MPSPMTIKIECEPYLIQFYTRIFGPQPILFPKGHVLAFTLRHLLDRPPRTPVPDPDYESCLEIQIPYNDEKNVLYNFHLSVQSKRIMSFRLEREFKLTFREDINASRLAGLKRNDAIHLFIDKYDLGEDIFDRLIKDYYRNYHLRRYYGSKKSRKKAK